MGAKLDSEQILTKLRLKLGPTYEFPNFIYKNMNEPITIKCLVHDYTQQTPVANILNKDVKCRKCSEVERSALIKKQMSDKFFNESVPEILKTRPNLSFDKFVYDGNKKKGVVTCNVPGHGDFETTVLSLVTAGSDCHICSEEKRLNSIAERKVSYEEFLGKAIEKFGDKFILPTKNEYKDYCTNVKIECPKHGSFKKSPKLFLHGSHGCTKCAKDSSSDLNLKMSKDDFILESNKIHNNKYDYSLVHDFKAQKEKVCIICPEHNKFEQVAYNHVRGAECMKCAAKKRGEEKIKTTGETFFDKMRELHKNKYTYPEQEYKGTEYEIVAICSQHGPFKQKAMYHAQGGGCQTCGGGYSVERLINFITSFDFELETLDYIELLTIINANNLSNRLKMMGKLKDLLKTRPNSEERKEVIESIKDSVESGLVEDELMVTEVNEDQLNQNVEITNEELDEIVLAQEQSDDVILAPIIPELRAMDNIRMTTSLDTENMEFMLKHKLDKVWVTYFDNRLDVQEYKDSEGGKNFEFIKERFFDEYNAAKNLVIPIDLNPTYVPTMMQRLITVRLLRDRRYANWSETGTGKTFGALFAGRVAGVKNMLIICNNSIVDGWSKQINEYFPSLNNNVVIVSDLDDRYNIKLKDGMFNYVVVNYEKFQQENSEYFANQLCKNNNFGMCVLDEVQNIKQRYADNQSKRRGVVVGLITTIREKNPDVYIHPMSATPVINNFYEPVGIVDMLTGIIHHDIDTRETIENGFEIHKLIKRHGLRYRGVKITNVNLDIRRIEINNYNDEFERIERGNILKMEQILLPYKLNEVGLDIRKGTLIFSIFVDGILDQIKDYVKSLGFTCGLYTSGNKDSLAKFKNGEIDVLISSNPITTGVDGLQNVCDRFIIISLPWTNAEFEQLKGRVINRTGCAFNSVDVIIPQVYIKNDNDMVIYDENSRYDRVKYKGTLMDLVIDGTAPIGKLPPKNELINKAIPEFEEWKRRLLNGEIITIQREELKVPLNPEFVETLQRKLGDFSEMNRVWSVSNSETTGERLKNSPEEWYQYHTLYREKRKEWNDIPYEHIGNKIANRPDWVVGDFGCGENLLSKMIPNQVHAFDHIAIDETVTACDISIVPLENNVLDVAVFSLSLMGSNYKEYLMEGHRTLKPYGIIWICEPKAKWEDKIDKLHKELEEIGFSSNVASITDRFIYVMGTKI